MNRWESSRMKRARKKSGRDTAIALFTLVGVLFAYHVACLSVDKTGGVKVKNLRGAAKYQAHLEVQP